MSPSNLRAWAARFAAKTDASWFDGYLRGTATFVECAVEALDDLSDGIVDGDPIDCVHRAQLLELTKAVRDGRDVERMLLDAPPLADFCDGGSVEYVDPPTEND
jgi:hypothetical protein